MLFARNGSPLCTLSFDKGLNGDLEDRAGLVEVVVVHGLRVQNAEGADALAIVVDRRLPAREEHALCIDHIGGEVREKEEEELLDAIHTSSGFAPIMHQWLVKRNIM